MMNLHLVNNNDGTFDVQNWKDKNGDDWEKVGTFVFDDDQDAWILWDDCYQDNKGNWNFVGDGVTYFDTLKDSFETVKEELQSEN